jgi:hypothetical protein
MAKREKTEMDLRKIWVRLWTHKGQDRALLQELMVAQLTINSAPVMKNKVTMRFSQEPVTDHYPE